MAVLFFCGIIHSVFFMQNNNCSTSRDSDWLQFASCIGADQNIFFPVSYTFFALERAKVYCDSCLVSLECLHAAITTDSLGIWSATTEKDRKFFVKKYIKKPSFSVTIEDVQQALEVSFTNNKK
jgi:hypothetical protein